MWEGDDLEAEHELLLGAAGTAVGAVPERVSEPAGTTAFDWQTVRELADRHGLLPQLHRYVEAQPALEPPSELRTAIADAATTTRFQNLHLADVLHDVLDYCEACSTRVLPVKGPIVADRAYGNLAGRPFSDLDLLVPSADLAATARTLQDEGFSLTTDLGPYGLEDATGEHRHLAFPQEISLASESGAEIELRHANADQFGDARLAIDELWRDRSTIEVAGRDLPALSPTDRYVFLSYHGSKHAWRRLEWLASLAGVVQRGEVDWEAARQRSRDRNLLEECYLGALLVATVFDADVPAAVERDARSADRVPEAAETVLEGLATDPLARPSDVDVQRFRGRLRGDRLRRYARFATTATLFDYRVLPLPRSLWPTYRVIRPVRMAVRRTGV